MDVAERIAEWHASDSPLPLHEYLGMTWDQYHRWVQDGEDQRERAENTRTNPQGH